MDQATVISIGRESLYVVIKVILPIVGLGLLTGLLVAIFQATTQIQEATLAFIPKILVILITIAIFGPWILATMVDFVKGLFESIPLYLG